MVAQAISVVVPTLNEAQHIEQMLAQLQHLRARGHEVIVVDGGSVDDTVCKARPLADCVLRSAKGRAVQMAAGAAQARHGILWFLHADTLLPERADEAILQALSAPGALWGRFDVRLSGTHPLLRLVEHMMNLRSRLSGICTGDQGVFVRREAYERVGGMPELPLMEDLALSRRLKALAPPVSLRERVTTSSRRWEQRGVVRTVLLMWGLRSAYALGVDPALLAKWYR